MFGDDVEEVVGIEVAPDDDWGEEEFPAFGESGSPENPDIHIKWIVDGAKTLGEVAVGLRAYADYCEELEKSGWQLSQPVDNSHGFVFAPDPSLVKDWVGV